MVRGYHITAYYRDEAPSGWPAKATALFGKHIVETQIDDAVVQIQELRVSNRKEK